MRFQIQIGINIQFSTQKNIVNKIVNRLIIQAADF